MSLFQNFQIKRPQVRQAHMYLAGVVVVLLLGVFLGFPKVQLFLDQKQALKDHAAVLESLNQEAKLSREASETARQTFGKELESFRFIVTKVLPDAENYTELTKQLDNFFDEHSEIKKNPIIAGSLRFGKGKKLQDSPFSILPASLTIESSKENFFIFLNYLETSGSLESGTRLMEVKAIQLNFSTDESGKENISFTIDLEAYYRETQASLKDTKTSDHGNPNLSKIPAA